MWKRKRSTFVLAGVLCIITLLLPQKLFAQAFSTEVPITVTLPNSCVPEDVLIEGTMKIVIQQNFDAATGSHFDIHFVSKGKGFGTLTAANYTYSEETENSLQMPGPPQTVAQEFVLNHVLIAGGQVPNFHFLARVHLTLNAKAIPTADVVSFSTRCQ